MAKSSGIGNTILIGALIGGAAYFMEEHGLFNSLPFMIRTAPLRFKILNVAPEDSDIVLNIKVQNPNSQSMSIKSFIGDLYANGRKIATIQMFGDYVARGNEEVTIPLIAKPEMALWHQLRNTFKGHNMKVMMTGTINVNDNAVHLALTA